MGGGCCSTGALGPVLLIPSGASSPQGDLKRYLRAQRKGDGLTPDLLTRDLGTLQRMAYEITLGLMHLHKNNYIHR